MLDSPILLHLFFFFLFKLLGDVNPHLNLHQKEEQARMRGLSKTAALQLV